MDSQDVGAEGETHFSTPPSTAALQSLAQNLEDALAPRKQRGGRDEGEEASSVIADTYMQAFPKSKRGELWRRLGLFWNHVISCVSEDPETSARGATALVRFLDEWMTNVHPASPTPASNSTHSAFNTDGSNLPQVVTDFCVQVHDSLFSLHEISTTYGQDWEVILERATKVSERYFLEKRAGRERAVPQLVPLVVLRAVEGVDAPSRALALLKDALPMLDLDDESASLLRQLLLRCFVSTDFWNSKDGRKLLALFLTQTSELTRDAHQVIRTQLAGLAKQKKKGAASSRAFVEGVGEVYFSAWKTLRTNVNESGSFLLAAYEADVVQDLIECAVFLQSESLGKLVRRVLNAAFHENKRERGVDELLRRSFEPILWRGLSASNASVRANALLTLANAFPIQDPGDTSEATSALINRQLEEIHNMLKDTNPEVRVAAIQCASRVLCVYWETIPARVASRMLQTMVNDLINDASSPKVRQAVLDGLSFLLDQPLAQTALQAALPHVGKRIHDVSPAVRLGLVELLVKVAELGGGIKFTDIADVESLLNRLALDGACAKENPTKLLITKRLVYLFVEVFYPQEAEGSEQIRRSRTLARSHPGAASAFFRHVRHVLPTLKVVKLALLMASFARGAVKKAISENSQDEEQRKQMALDVEACLRAAEELWSSVHAELSAQSVQHAEAIESLRSKFSHGVDFGGRLWSWTDLTHKSRLSVLKLVGFSEYRSGDSTDLEKSLLQYAKGADCEVEQEELELRGIVDCLVEWKREKAIVDQACETLEDNFKVQRRRSSAGKRLKAVNLSLAWACAVLDQVVRNTRDAQILERITLGFKEVRAGLRAALLSESDGARESGGLATVVALDLFLSLKHPRVEGDEEIDSAPTQTLADWIAWRATQDEAFFSSKSKKRTKTGENSSANASLQDAVEENSALDCVDRLLLAYLGEASSLGQPLEEFMTQWIASATEDDRLAARSDRVLAQVWYASTVKYARPDAGLDACVVEAFSRGRLNGALQALLAKPASRELAFAKLAYPGWVASREIQSEARSHVGAYSFPVKSLVRGATRALTRAQSRDSEESIPLVRMLVALRREHHGCGQEPETALQLTKWSASVRDRSMGGLSEYELESLRLDAENTADAFLSTNAVRVG